MVIQLINRAVRRTSVQGFIVIFFFLQLGVFYSNNYAEKAPSKIPVRTTPKALPMNPAPAVKQEIKFAPEKAADVKFQKIYEYKYAETKKMMESAKSPVSMDDPMLEDIIRKEFLRPPSTEAYSKSAQEWAKGRMFGGQFGQARVIDDYLKNKRNGFFIEAGAWNGVYLSNSLYLEMARNWTGLLVEANGKAFNELIANHRKATAVEGCLSLHKYPEKVTFDGADVFGGIEDANLSPHKAEEMKRARNGLPQGFRASYNVQCFPLYSLLRAMGNPKVDYFSLDVEGAEIEILKTIPWNLVNIETLSIEHAHTDKNQLKEYMLSQGYSLLKEIDVDFIFVKKAAA